MTACDGNCGKQLVRSWDGWGLTDPVGDHCYFCSLECLSSWLDSVRL